MRYPNPGAAAPPIDEEVNSNRALDLAIPQGGWQ